jgi:hypothetical protein
VRELRDSVGSLPQGLKLSSLNTSECRAEALRHPIRNFSSVFAT